MPVRLSVSAAAPVLVTIAGRYGSILVVFAVLAILARRLPLADYGEFVLAYGVAATLYFLSGLGVPDGGVRVAAEALARGERARAAGAVRGILVSGLLSLGAAVAIAVVMALVPGRGVVAATALWAGTWALLFAAAQALLALGRTRAAGLFFYAAGGASMLVTVVPYALLASSPGASGAILCAALGYGLAAGVGALLAAISARPLGPAEPSGLGFLAGTGLPFAATRVVQTALVWSAPWAIGFFHGAAEAGLVGTALRVAAAVGAALSALRFALRPTLIRLYARGEHERLARLLRRVGAAAFLIALGAAVFMLGFGEALLALFFGDAFAAANIVLVLALVALAGEGMTGLSDDLVRVAHRAGKVLAAQVAFTACAIGLIIALSPLGTLPAMSAYVAYPYLFGAIMLFWSHRCLDEMRGAGVR